MAGVSSEVCSMSKQYTAVILLHNITSLVVGWFLEEKRCAFHIKYKLDKLFRYLINILSIKETKITLALAQQDKLQLSFGYLSKCPNKNFCSLKRCHLNSSHRFSICSMSNHGKYILIIQSNMMFLYTLSMLINSHCTLLQYPKKNANNKWLSLFEHRKQSHFSMNVWGCEQEAWNEWTHVRGWWQEMPPTVTTVH